MILSLVLGLVLGAASIIFALQNTFPVTVTFLSWGLNASLAIIIILSLLLGALISILITIPGVIRNYFTISGLKKENRKLHEEVVRAQKAEITSLVPPTSQPPRE